METVKITNLELRSAMLAINQLSQQRLPAKLAYALARTRRSLQDAFDATEEVRQRLMEQYQKENGEIAEEGQKEWQELLKQEVEVKVHLADITHLPEEIEPWIIDALMFMLKE